MRFYLHLTLSNFEVFWPFFRTWSSRGC